MSESKNVKFIEPEYRFDQIVLPDGPLAVNEEQLEKADNAINEFAEEYIADVKNDLNKLREAIDSLDDTKSGQAEKLKTIFLISHKIKGLGGSFGYELVTNISFSLYRFIESLEGSVKAYAKDVMDLHLAGLQVVISEEIKGEGGQAGEEMLSGLMQVVHKFSKAEVT